MEYINLCVLVENKINRTEREFGLSTVFTNQSLEGLFETNEERLNCIRLFLEKRDNQCRFGTKLYCVIWECMEIMKREMWFCFESMYYQIRNGPETLCLVAAV